MGNGRAGRQDITLTHVQAEKAFQKQDGVFLNSKKLLGKKTSTGVRYFKKVGLGRL